MKLSATTTAVLALAAASAQHVSATDFDFRDFEGLWETTPNCKKGIDTGNTSDYGLPPANLLTTFVCEATGDFRKAVCEMTSVTPAHQGCISGLWIVPDGYYTAVQKCKFMLDQFDAETGKVGPLMCDLQCCSSGGCSDYPWLNVARTYNFLANAELSDNALGPQMNVEITMLAGKNKNSVRAIQVVQQPMISDEGQAKLSGARPFAFEFQIRKTAGGFKSVE